jgi:hypothetical protein
MQLLHFTAAQNIPSIQAQGLKPVAVPRDGFIRGWPHGCVWFTREPVVTWWDDPSLSACRVLVVLSSRFGPARVVRSPAGCSPPERVCATAPRS